jgi:hypothetical protein
MATTFVGCDMKQATNSIDKVKTFTDDLEKKVQKIIPGSDQGTSGSKNGEEPDKKEEDKED